MTGVWPSQGSRAWAVREVGPSSSSLRWAERAFKPVVDLPRVRRVSQMLQLVTSFSRCSATCV